MITACGHAPERQRQIKIAYGFQVHADPQQFGWVFKALYNPQDVFSVHIDRKASPAVTEKFRAIAGTPDNLVYLPSSEVYWGGWSVARIEIEAIRRLLAIDFQWTHFINISGNCYPLTSRSERLNFLAAHGDQNFVELHTRVEDSPKLQERISWQWEERLIQPVRTDRPKVPPSGFRADFNGECWHVLARSFCEWIVNSDLAKRIQDFFIDVSMADEFVVQALLLNSPFCDSVGPFMWETRWRKGAYHPEILSMNDAEALLGSGRLFARKFSQRVDSRILQLLAERTGAARPDQT